MAGNYIGTDVSGTTALGNGGKGVQIGGGGGAQLNTVGTNGDGIGDPAEANTIAFNVASGVVVSGGSSTGNSIRGNSIHSNGALGIDLNDDGVTLNDPGDGDAGPNGLQNCPVLESVDAGATTRVVGSFNGAPGTTLTIDVYANQAADPSGFGEGQRHLGFFTVTTDAAGNAAFDETLAAASTGGEFISATATDPAGRQYQRILRRPGSGRAAGRNRGQARRRSQHRQHRQPRRDCRGSFHH